MARRSIKAGKPGGNSRKPMVKARYEIEDRTAFPEGAMGAGMWVLWKVCSTPFPHRAYRGKFATKGEAEAARRNMKA